MDTIRKKRDHYHRLIKVVSFVCKVVQQIQILPCVSVEWAGPPWKAAVSCHSSQQGRGRGREWGRALWTLITHPLLSCPNSQEIHNCTYHINSAFLCLVWAHCCVCMCFVKQVLPCFLYIYYSWRCQYSGLWISLKHVLHGVISWKYRVISVLVMMVQSACTAVCACGHSADEIHAYTVMSGAVECLYSNLVVWPYTVLNSCSLGKGDGAHNICHVGLRFS